MNHYLPNNIINLNMQQFKTTMIINSCMYMFHYWPNNIINSCSAVSQIHVTSSIHTCGATSLRTSSIQTYSTISQPGNTINSHQCYKSTFIIKSFIKFTSSIDTRSAIGQITINSYLQRYQYKNIINSYMCSANRGLTSSFVHEMLLQNRQHQFIY